MITTGVLNKDKKNVRISDIVEGNGKKKQGKKERRYIKVFHMENDNGKKITVPQKNFCLLLVL